MCVRKQDRPPPPCARRHVRFILPLHPWLRLPCRQRRTARPRAAGRAVKAHAPCTRQYPNPRHAVAGTFHLGLLVRHVLQQRAVHWRVHGILRTCRTSASPSGIDRSMRNSESAAGRVCPPCHAPPWTPPCTRFPMALVRPLDAHQAP
jgi:hypothetical protein